MALTQTPVLHGDTSRFHGCSGIREYDVLGKLGEGTFGEVHKARSRQTGAIVALKKILMHNEKDGFPITALREIKIMKLLSHPNVLRLVEMAIERPLSKGKEKPKAIMYMVSPYMDHDLSGLLENPKVDIKEAHIKCYMLQLLQGVQFLHNNHILHRDMKAANLLINNQGLVQIADFGLARHYDEPVPRPGHGGGEARRDYTALVVTRWYRPPELLLQLRKYTTAIDMWGVGCVFGEMWKRHPILMGKSDLNQIQQIFDLMGSPTDENMPGWSDLPGCDGTTSFSTRRGKVDSDFRDIGAPALELLKEFLRLDWRKRINAVDALDHQYFKTHPLPADRHDLPKYEDSHELDRKKFRDQKAAAPPPAPAGGTVGMGAHGDWTNGPPQSGYHYNSGPPSHDYRNTGGYDRRGGYERRPLHNDRGFDSRRPPPGGRSGFSRPHESLPPRPPRPGDPIAGVSRVPPAARTTNTDSYVPSYSDSGQDGRPRSRDDRDRRPPRDDRDRNRDYDHRDRGRDYRERDREPQRDRERAPRDGRDRNGEYTRSNGLPSDRARSRSPDRSRDDKDREREMLYRR